MRGIDKLLNYIIQNQDKLIQDSGVQDTSLYNNRLKNNNFVEELPCDDEEFNNMLELLDDVNDVTFSVPEDPSLIPADEEKEVPEHIKEMNIQIMLDSLIDSGIILEYEIDGEKYYKFKK